MREAYLQFMVSVASMLRADMSLPGGRRRVQEDMAQVLRLETQLANVSQASGGRARAPAATPRHRRPPPAGHGPPGGEA